jgi:hypothetical protein
VSYVTPIVKRQRDAHGAHCLTCDTALNGCWLWDFRKSVAMHRQGCPDHNVVLYRVVYEADSQEVAP